MYNAIKYDTEKLTVVLNLSGTSQCNLFLERIVICLYFSVLESIHLHRSYSKLSNYFVFGLTGFVPPDFQLRLAAVN
jgi:hypothetical protein